MSDSAYFSALGTFERLRDAYFRYYDTPFGLSDERLQAERRALLDVDGGVYREPLLETRPEYASSPHDLSGSVASTGAHASLAEFAHCGLLPQGRPLYGHQEDALRAGVVPGGNMVITAGTGSGKTESFMLPVLSSLLDESASWQAAGSRPDTEWWNRASGSFIAQRGDGESRMAATRAIVLYPMNALVDDQLMRMRRALDSDEARTWLDKNRGGNRFYFGRYTGATPVSGEVGNASRQPELKQWLKATDARGAQARSLAKQSGNEDVNFFVPRLDGAEMRSRWDMLTSPPDILVTNYSMLNVMLLRDRDDIFFESTLRWLEDPNNRFTLVVDELHSYRGTSGTEVAYLVRALKQRLGLVERPEQFRVLAASASLNPASDAEYLEQFFGVSANRFTFVEGTLRRVTPVPTGETDLHALERATTAELSEVVVERRLHDAFRDATAGGARTAAKLGSMLFPGAEPERSTRAVRRLVESFASSELTDAPRLRAHYFFRNIAGMWACSDPACTEVPDSEQADRTVGQLFAIPATRCGCGARVLELLYCQNCGDVFLGGFTPEGTAANSHLDANLLADVPELAKLPDQVSLQRTASNYVVYWPRPTAADEIDSIEWSGSTTGKSVEFRFVRSVYTPRDGRLQHLGRSEPTGWAFQVHARAKSGKPSFEPTSLSPFPTRCPACGDDWEIKRGAKGKVFSLADSARQRSPIRPMRTGFEKINQVLTSELLNDLDNEERKVVVFTDSRQDAAKLSSGLSLRHYQDLLRQLIADAVRTQESSAGEIELAKLDVDPKTRTAESSEAYKKLKARNSDALESLREIWQGFTADVEEPALRRVFTRPLTLRELTRSVQTRLLSLGMNPGGPKASLQSTPASNGSPSTHWTALFNWNGSEGIAAGGLSPAQTRLAEDIESSLFREIIDALFSGAGRDFESLGLGWLATTEDSGAYNHDDGHDLARSSLRILAGMKRFQDLRSGSDRPPAKLKKHLEAVASARNVEYDDLVEGVLLQSHGSLLEYVIDPDKVTLNTAPAAAWECTKCHRIHLTSGDGLCTRCHTALPPIAAPVEFAQDYYSWRATRDDGQFRLNTAELTGQTNRIEAQSRQSRFQDVFLGDEHPIADGIDLLSVTTTMEAGVDIGALSAVVLGNMPPTRFNYQQRVGRAGRRDSPVAIALTACRGRSHDEHYFQHPEEITSAPTPSPKLVLNRPELFQRSFRSRILRAGFAHLSSHADYQGLDWSNNVHGAFGLVTDWISGTDVAIKKWANKNREELLKVGEALAHRTGLDGRSQASSCLDTLAADINLAVAGAGHAELSQRLAERGLLPMFGFPTSVRNLHLSRPNRPSPWPPADVVDRDDAMAVSQFSPMSEIVRDGRVHKVIGFADFRPAGPHVQPVADVLGLVRWLYICQQCAFIQEGDEPDGTETGTCPSCGAEPGPFRSVRMHSPLGYRANDDPADFDGAFSWSPRAMTARARTNLDNLERQQDGGLVIAAGRGERYVVNDNGGRQFSIRAAADRSPWGGYVSSDAIREGIINESFATGDEFDIALGTRQTSDFLFVGTESSLSTDKQLRFNLQSHLRQPFGNEDPYQGRRAAWYSLAFLLRKVGSTVLDVSPLEFTAGLFATQGANGPETYAFLADTLENGAGFSTQLGGASYMTLAKAIADFIGELDRPAHADRCNASCYSCLRDYGNLAYHALLDWRLARDLWSSLRSQTLIPDLKLEEAAARAWASSTLSKSMDLGGAWCAIRDDRQHGRFAIIVKHPLETSEDGGPISNRLQQALASVMDRLEDLDGVVFIDTFTLDRDPRKVDSMINEQQT